MTRVLKSAAMFSLPIVFAVCALPAFAVDVTFTTTGRFCAGAGPCLVGNQTDQIGNFPQETFIAENPVSETVPLNTDNVPLIKFALSDIGSNPRPGTGSFTIDITQTAPTAGMGFFTGALSGNYAVGSSTATITFSQPSVVIGGVLYTLDHQTYVFPTINPPTKVDVLTADVTATPEPSFMMLSGLGFFGLVAFGARRYKRAADTTV